MGILFDQAIRLLKTKWKSTQLLAEELFAIFQADQPVRMDSPLEITVEGEEAPLKLRDFSDGDFSIRIEGRDNQIGGITFGDNGLQFVDENGDPVSGGEEPEPATTNAFPAKILSQVSGQDYTVELYENGPSQAATDTVTVTQLQIADGEVIPEDTWTIVTRQTVEGTDVYSMQVPVWLEDAA